MRAVSCRAGLQARRSAGLQPRGRVGSGASRILITALFVLLAVSSSVYACPQCFGAEETTLVAGTKLGILVLLGIVLTVQGLFAAFFLRLRSRAKRAADVERDTEGRGQANYDLPTANYRRA